MKAHAHLTHCVRNFAAQSPFPPGGLVRFSSKICALAGMGVTMKIIEQFIASKTNNDINLCEDGIFAGEHFVAVIDGVTSKGQYRWDGGTSGYRAKEIIIHTLGTLSGTESRDSVFQALNEALSECYQDVGFFHKNPEERLQATIVIYSTHAAQAWLFGDCQLLLNGKLYSNEMKIDGLLAELRSVYLELEMLNGAELEALCRNDPSQELIMPVLKRQFLFSNKDCEYGYPVLDGFCDDFSRVEAVDVPKHSEVILASDGYPILYPSLEESERYLDWLRENDPLCTRIFKSTRGFTNGKTALDDRAYIRFTT